MQKKSPEQNYPAPVDPAAIGAQFGLTPTNTHRHTGNPMDGVRINAGDIAGLTAFVQALIPAVVSTPIYAGQIVSNAAGSFFPSGWSLTHVGTGIYKITHNLGIANTSYSFVAYPTFSGEAYCISGYNPVDTNNIEVYVNNPDSSFAFQNSDLYFMLITQANP